MMGGSEGDCWVGDIEDPFVAEAERDAEVDYRCKVEDENSDVEIVRGAAAAVGT